MRNIYEIEEGDLLTKIEWDWVNGGHILELYQCVKIIKVNALIPSVMSSRFNNIKAVILKNYYTKKKIKVEVNVRDLLLERYRIATPIDIITVKSRYSTR